MAWKKEKGLLQSKFSSHPRQRKAFPWQKKPGSIETMAISSPVCSHPAVCLFFFFFFLQRDQSEGESAVWNPEILYVLGSRRAQWRTSTGPFYAAASQVAAPECCAPFPTPTSLGTMVRLERARHPGPLPPGITGSPSWVRSWEPGNSQGLGKGKRSWLLRLWEARTG